MAVHPSDIAASIACIITSALGLLCNVCLLLVLLSCKDLRKKDYVIFITRRCLIELLNCLNTATLEPPGSLHGV